jgi:hypothetical protein
MKKNEFGCFSINRVLGSPSDWINRQLACYHEIDQISPRGPRKGHASHRTIHSAWVRGSIFSMFVLRAEIVTIFEPKMVTISARNTNILKICKLRKAMFSVFYNISQPTLVQFSKSSPTRAGSNCQRKSYRKWPVPCKTYNFSRQVRWKCEPPVLGENSLNMTRPNFAILLISLCSF